MRKRSSSYLKSSKLALVLPSGPDGDQFIQRGPMIFPHWPHIQRDALSTGPQVQSAAHHISQEGESEISEESGSKVRSPNWTDVEVRLLISV